MRDARGCRLCGGEALAPILDLGVLALTGVFPRSPEEEVPAGPLRLLQCQDGCGFMQLETSWDPAILFGETYGYRSSLNASMVRHLMEVAEFVQDMVSLRPGDCLVDIGANDGTFLSGFPPDCRRVAIDPLADRFGSFYDPSIERIPALFSRGLVDGKAKIVSSLAMLYDVEDPLAFARDVRELLTEDGAWVIEVADFERQMRQGIYDAVCHEHVGYYGVSQLRWMLEKVGFTGICVRRTDCNGGSLLVIARKTRPSDPTGEVAPDEGFQQKAERHRDALRELLEGKDVIGFGASTKGNVLLQYCNLHLPCIVDVNPDKWGRVTPGTRIPIVKEANADYSLALPWHFKSSIMAVESGQFIFPFPTPHVESSCGGSSIVR